MASEVLAFAPVAAVLPIRVIASAAVLAEVNVLLPTVKP